MKIQREDYIHAPDGDAVHAYGQSYTGPRGSGMIESVVHHAFNGSYYYTRQLYRRRSADGGRTWKIDGPMFEADLSKSRAAERTGARHFLDPHSGVLIALHSEWLIQSNEPQFSSNTTSASYRIFYEISHNQGKTWSPSRQVIHRGAGYNETDWLPGVTYGHNGAYAESCVPVALDDGTIVVGIVSEPLDCENKLYRPGGAGYWFHTGFLRGRWNADHTALEWELGEWLKTSPELSSVGVCEPDLIHLGGQRLFATMRCQGRPGQHTPSSRQGAVSNDGGRTWSRPAILRYDDGEPVYVPASYSAFLRSPRSEKIYWFTNILDHPVYAQYPRCPLTIAELDPDRLCLIRESVKVIQGLPPGALCCTNELPTTDEECGRQYTNFGSYIDRESGEMVIVVPEMPRTTWKAFTSDCIRIRVRDRGEDAR